MKKYLLMMSAFALIATPALANKDGHHMKHDWFAKMDTNGDGFISKKEHDAFSQKRFGRADKNGDGRLSTDEFSAHKMKEHNSGAMNDVEEDYAPASKGGEVNRAVGGDENK